MSWFFKLLGSTSGNVAEVDANNNVKANLPTTPAQSGYAALAVESDTGLITGTRAVKKLGACEDGALYVSQFTRFLTTNFPGTVLDSTLWTSIVTTMTTSVAGGLLSLNAGLSTAISAVAQVRTYRHFPIDAGNHTTIEIVGQFAQTPVANNVTEWGCGLASGTSAPTDGAFFRLNATGEFRAILNNNGSEIQSGTLNFAALVGTNTAVEFYIIFNDTSVVFKIGDNVAAEIALPTGGGTLTASQNLPVFFRTYNTAATSAAQVIKIGGATVRLDMTDTSKAWPDVLAGGGGHASQGQTGATLGTTANYANSANPTAAVPTNTTAALGSGLGGQFWETDTLAVTTDGIISSYQVPLGTAALPGKSLYITRIRISSFIQVVLTGGPYVAQWSLAYGHNTVSLASAEAATTKAPRRIPLGVQPVTAAQAVSTIVGTPIEADLTVPVVVQPGEFIQVVKKKVGTAPTAGVIAHVISIGGYWE